jgi:hypothetical protein
MLGLQVQTSDYLIVSAPMSDIKQLGHTSSKLEVVSIDLPLLRPDCLTQPFLL